MSAKTALFLSAALALASSGAVVAETGSVPLPRQEAWLVKSLGELQVPPPSGKTAEQLAELKSIMAKRTDADVERIRWWAVGGPVYRWNEIVTQELMDGFVVLPMAARHLALVHAAMDDAVAAAWKAKKAHRVPRPSTACATVSRR